MKTKLFTGLIYALSVVSSNAGVIHFENGWNIVSFGELNHVDVNKTLSLMSDGSIVWTYDNINKNWLAKSNNLQTDTLILSNKFQLAKYIEKYHGFWIYNAGNNIDLNTCQLIPNEEIIEPVADSYVYAYDWHNWDNANFGAYGSLNAGYSSIGGESRVYIKFNLSNIDVNSLKKADLRLQNGAQYAGTDNIDLGIYAVKSSWNEGNGTYHSGVDELNAPANQITWHNQPTIDTNLIATFNPSNYQQGSMMTIDITNLVKSWKTSIDNYGLVIKPLITSGNSQWIFSSRESPYKDTRPALIILKDCNTSN